MRRFIRAIALLIGGAAMNLLVALACSRWGDHWPYGGEGSPLPVESVPADAVEYLSDPDYLGSFGPDRPTGLQVFTRRSFACTRVTFDRWHDRKFLVYNRSHELVRFGLPFRSMQYAARSWYAINAFPESVEWRLPDRRGGWPLAPTRQGPWSGYPQPAHIYPLTVIPLGFAADSLLYATMLSALAAAPGFLRRRTRRRHRLCERCGYPIGVSPVCTECGTAINQRPARGPPPVP